jgi:cytochrome c oxidase cbb3-type subunit II
MSELLTSASAALGLPESLVRRSAEARAAETGASVDEVLAAWAGGGSVPTPPVGSPEPAEATTAGGDPPDPSPAEEAAAVPAATQQPAVPAPDLDVRPEPEIPAGPYKPPVLVGAVDNPMAVFAGVVGLFVLVLLVGLIGPSIPSENPGARTSAIAFSDSAQRGQTIYMSMGCAACHTQMVRPVVADVGLGPVTLNDTNQVLGARRYGPDLSDVGSRATITEMESLIRGGFGHPPHRLSDADMARLVAYMRESRASRQAAG